ncbi:MAG: hypothetical protein IT555_03800 [Acetobacteraceae bacterium]|nr:hypothetical protein [Acetobacteraceae bacterium]
MLFLLAAFIGYEQERRYRPKREPTARADLQGSECEVICNILLEKNRTLCAAMVQARDAAQRSLEAARVAAVALAVSSAAAIAANAALLTPPFGWLLSGTLLAWAMIAALTAATAAGWAGSAAVWFAQSKAQEARAREIVAIAEADLAAKCGAEALEKCRAKVAPCA